MLKNKTISFLTIVFVVLFSIFKAVSCTAQEDKMAHAVQLFENKNFSEAELVFHQLLENQPDDPTLNYYYGSCLTESGIFTTSALNYLLKADKGEVPVKTDYYLGIQYQSQSKWEQALRHYNKFRIETKKTEQEKLNLAEKIQQCYNRENPFSMATQPDLIEDTSPTNDTLTANNISELPVKPKKDTLQNSIPDSINTIEHLSSGKPIEFIINSEIIYLNTTNFRTDEGKELFDKASAKQRELDFSLQEANKLREDYREAATEGEKKIIGDKILSFENETYRLKDEITHLLEQSRNVENTYWQNAPAQELTDFKAKIEQLAQTISAPEPEEDSTNAMPDSSVIIDPNILLNKIDVEKVTTPAEQPETDELVYKIQIGAYSRGLPRYVDRLYKKLSVIRKIDHYTDENGVTVYTTGSLTNLDDAIKMQKQVRQEGVEDAFVVPYFNGKRITLKQAKEIAKEL